MDLFTSLGPPTRIRGRCCSALVAQLFECHLLKPPPVNEDPQIGHPYMSKTQPQNSHTHVHNGCGEMGFGIGSLENRSRWTSSHLSREKRRAHFRV